MFTAARQRTAFSVLTALVVAIVRNTIQYGEYWFSSFWMFLGMWFVHYVAIMLVAAVYFVALDSLRSRLLPGRSKASVEDALVQFCLAIVISSIAIFVLYHWPDSGTLD